MFRQTDTIEGNFTTKIATQCDVPGSIPGFSQAIEIHRIEIGNNSGGDARVGWGYSHPDGYIKVGDWDVAGGSPKYTDKTVELAAGATVLGTDGGIMIQSAEPYHSIQFNVTVLGGAITAQKYWDGSTFKTFSSAGSEHVEYDTLDLTGTGLRFGTVIPPKDWAALLPADSPVTTDGLTVGQYVWLIEIASVITADNLDLVRLLNRVEAVSNGNTLVDSYDGGKKLPNGAKIVPYCSVTNKANSVIAEYSKSP